MADEAPTFAVGDVVCVSGLQSRPELNQYKAQVQSYDPEKDRYTVQFITGIGGEEIILALKPANLKPAGAPPSPPGTPSPSRGSTRPRGSS